MFKKFSLAATAAVCLAGMSAQALGADVAEPAPPLMEPVVVSAGGWYLRGDIDYHWSQFEGADYITYGPPAGTNSFTSGSFDGAMSLGVGIGYQINNWLRTDLTGDYWFDADFTGSTSGTCGGLPCSSVDTSSMSAFLLLANAYVDLGTYYSITPYLGAGIGGAYLKWDDLNNNISGSTTVHQGTQDWRFAWALMAGASYCLTENLDLDVGYRYSRIEGGRMFEYNFAGPGFDEDFGTHEVRAGLRWNFGDYTPRPGCGSEYVAYTPEPAAVYK
jgi:opacity protein-like surface antigen